MFSVGERQRKEFAGRRESWRTELVDDAVVLDRLKQLLVLNWRQKTAARSALRLTIEDTLDTGLPRA